MFKASCVSVIEKLCRQASLSMLWWDFGSVKQSLISFPWWFGGSVVVTEWDDATLSPLLVWAPGLHQKSIATPRLAVTKAKQQCTTNPMQRTRSYVTASTNNRSFHKPLYSNAHSGSPEPLSTAFRLCQPHHEHPPAKRQCPRIPSSVLFYRMLPPSAPDVFHLTLLSSI